MNKMALLNCHARRFDQRTRVCARYRSGRRHCAERDERSDVRGSAHGGDAVASANVAGRRTRPRRDRHAAPHTRQVSRFSRRVVRGLQDFSADGAAGGLPLFRLQCRATGIHGSFRSRPSRLAAVVKNSSGNYVLVGAMYSAPSDYTYDQLDAIIPLSVAHWHAHTNICLPSPWPRSAAGSHARCLLPLSLLLPNPPRSSLSSPLLPRLR
jgi:hypothetical protein